jgi:parallel beta-helix repeat protein
MTVYYVSPTGNDAASGLSTNSAFATLGAAIKAMAGSGTADTTYVLDGTYYLNGKGLSLTSANSNDTIAAYQGATPVISGGSAVPSTGWTVGANGIWSIQLNNTNDVEQLTVNGQSQTLARYPNEVPSDTIKGGWLWAQALPAGYNPTNHIAYNPADFPAGQPPAVGEKVSIFDAANWSSNLLTITAVDTTQHVITFGQSSWFNLGPGSRYFISNAQPLLDQPGEWYFNQATHTLYYHPPAGFTGSGAVVSGETSIINVSNAHNVTIHGLSFADAATKAAVDYITTAAVTINSSTGVVIDGNNFSNVAQGVLITGSSSHNTVSNNSLSNTWGDAIEVSGGASQNLITQDSIQNTNTVFATSGAIQLESTSNNTISYNYIHDVPRSGITDFQTSGSSGANLIEYNTIVNSGLKGNDLGAIYAYAGSNTSALGDTVAYNKVISPGGLGTTSSGFISGDYWGVGIYMDDGTGNAQIYGNFISGGTVGGIFLAGGNNNHVWNNIITGTHQAAGGGLGYGILLGSFANTTPMAGTQVHDNIIQIPSGASAISFQNGIVNPSALYSNIYYGSSSSALKIANMTLSQFQAQGGDQASTFVSDPGFADAAHQNFSLLPGSYALTHGFQDLPWDQIALAGVQGRSQTNLTIPAITSFSSDSGLAGDAITNDNTLTLMGTADANTNVKIYDGATLLGSVTAGATGAWSYTTQVLNNGAHSLTATATDALGNTSAASTALSVTIDTAVPVAPTIGSFSTDSGVAGDRITNDNTLTLTGTAEANATVKIYDGTTLLNSLTASGTGAWSYTTGVLSSGAHSLTATATDVAGNTGVASTALVVTVDTVVPVAPTIGSFSTDSGVLGDRITNDNTLTLAGTAEANATVKIYDGAALLNSVTASGTGAWSYTTAALANGAHSLTATATDVAGNTGAASTALVVTVDTVAPTVTQTTATPSTGTAFSGDKIAITLQLSEAVTVTGTPVLILNDGGTATYTGGSGSNALSFSYIVNTGDSTVSALAVTAISLSNGAEVKDVASNPANLSGVLTTFSGLHINPPTAPVAPGWNNPVSPNTGNITSAPNSTNDSITAVDPAGDNSLARGLVGRALVGNTAADTFTFDGGMNHIGIADFQASDHVLQPGRDVFANFAETFAATAQHGPDTTIDFGLPDPLILHATMRAQLSGDNFHLA